MTPPCGAGRKEPAGAPAALKGAGVWLMVLLTTVVPGSSGAMERPASLPGPAGPVGGKVVFVADGDTVRAIVDGRSEWIRLLRIDTPEKEERGYGPARAKLSSMVDSQFVTIEFEKKGVPERDEHGRLLAYLFVGPRNVNVEMVLAGWSPFWTRYGEGRYARQFREAEASARRAKRGLWGRSPQP